MPPTRYTVVALEEADNELLTLWLNSPSERRAITRASYELETDLRHDAGQKGAPRPTPAQPTRRYLERGPLGVYFEVSEPDRLVRILGFVKLPAGP
jgi:hypothetical protein